jgi:hypothetical protein
MNAMNTNPSISVEVTSGLMDSNGHETFTVNFVGDPVTGVPQPSVTAQARTVWFGSNVVFIVVDSAQFENVPDENKVELLLMVPKAIVRLRHIRGEMIAVFADALAVEIPYLREISVSTESIKDTRMALSNFIEEADHNLVQKGYFFHPAEPAVDLSAAAPFAPPRPDLSAGAEGTVAPGFTKTPVDTAGGSNPVPAAPLPEPGAVVAEVSRVADISGHTVKKMKIGFDEKQLMMAGATVAALGEAITIDFRSKVNGEKFEIVAIDSLQTIGVEIDTALGLAFGALSLTKRLNPELPLELGLTKGGCEELCALIEDLEENSKWSSHLNLHLIDADYVKTKITAATEQGYVAALEE